MPRTLPAESTTGTPLMLLLTSSCGARWRGVSESKSGTGKGAVCQRLRVRLSARHDHATARATRAPNVRGTKSTAGAADARAREAQRARPRRSPNAAVGGSFGAALAAQRTSRTSKTDVSGRTSVGGLVMTSRTRTSASEIATEGPLLATCCVAACRGGAGRRCVRCARPVAYGAALGGGNAAPQRRAAEERGRSAAAALPQQVGAAGSSIMAASASGRHGVY